MNSLSRRTSDLRHGSLAGSTLESRDLSRPDCVCPPVENISIEEHARAFRNRSDIRRCCVALLLDPVAAN